MKIGIATMEKVDNRPLNSVGSSRIRGRWLAKYWDEAQEYQVGRRYDVMIFQKAYWREMLLQFEGIKIFDICDPDWLDPRPVIESINFCNAAITSTQALADYIKQFVKDRPVVCIPDRLDLEEHTPRGPHEGTAKSAVWFGYSHNAQYLTKTFDFLIEKGLELTVISNTPINAPMGFERLKIHNLPYSYESVNEEIRKHDMVLLPSTGDDLRGKFKSNNKVLSAWALGLPVVQEPEDFDRFMEAEERNKERELRLKEIKEKWDIRLSVEEYKALIGVIRG